MTDAGIVSQGYEIVGSEPYGPYIGYQSLNIGVATPGKGWAAFAGLPVCLGQPVRAGQSDSRAQDA